MPHVATHELCIQQHTGSQDSSRAISHAASADNSSTNVAADGDNQLIESNVVSEYLDLQYKSTGTKLFPEDPLLLAKVSICSSALACVHWTGYAVRPPSVIDSRYLCMQMCYDACASA